MLTRRAVLAALVSQGPVILVPLETCATHHPPAMSLGWEEYEALRMALEAATLSETTRNKALAILRPAVREAGPMNRGNEAGVKPTKTDRF